MRNIQQQVKTKDSHVVYKEMVAKRGDDITEKPRNPKQVANIKFKVDKEKRLSHDALLNVHEIAREVPDYIWQITTHPDLVIKR